jgi:hypothetical protein
VTQGAHDIVTFTSTGVTYTPNANDTGSDSFNGNGDLDAGMYFNAAIGGE